MKPYRFAPVQDYCDGPDFIRNQYFETIFMDEPILTHAIMFYNAYMGYTKDKIGREEALMYAKLGTRINAEFFRVIRPRNEEELNGFYEVTPFHFFNNIIRFMDGMHRTMVIDFEKRGKSPFLDFGGGTGGFSLYLASRGHDVTYVESNRLCIGWMKYITGVLKLSVKILEPHEKIEGKFKFIIAKDIVEHVVDPGKLKSYLDSLLDEGGQIHATHYPCCGPDDTAPMHFKVDVEKDGDNENLVYSPEANLHYLKYGKYPQTVPNNPLQG